MIALRIKTRIQKSARFIRVQKLPVYYRINPNSDCYEKVHIHPCFSLFNVFSFATIYWNARLPHTHGEIPNLLEPHK